MSWDPADDEPKPKRRPYYSEQSGYCNCWACNAPPEPEDDE